MLILPIKRKWFDMIRSGEKKEEYREIKPYWTRRFEKIYFSKRLTPEKIHSLKRYTTLPAEIMFRNGYRRDSPYIRCFCSLTVGQGKEEWGAEKRKRVLCIRNIGGRKMREIKFRGKDYNNKWRYGNLVQEKWGQGKAIIIKKDKTAWSVLEGTIGQYTGLKDKNGKEIYEGDIVRTKYMDKTFIVWVEYSDEYAEFVTKCKEILFFDEPLSDIGRADREVIGNIYDNPELLEEDYNV